MTFIMAINRDNAACDQNWMVQRAIYSFTCEDNNVYQWWYLSRQFN